MSIAVGMSFEFEKKANYKVIKVKGHIQFVRTGADMKMGDVYVAGTSLNFVTTSSRAAVVNKSVRFVIQSNSKGKVKVLPATSNVTSRAGALINLIDLQNHFSGKYLMFDNEKLQIGKEAFPMDDTHFFYVKYMYNNESIAKRLEFENNYLKINKESLFKVDGKSIKIEEKEMTLYYRDDVEKRSFKINTFTPVFPDLNVLKTEVEMLLSESEKLTSDQKLAQVTSYLNEFYGKPQKDNLINWLDKEFDLKFEQVINFK
jgi:hypothetical protein